MAQQDTRRRRRIIARNIQSNGLLTLILTCSQMQAFGVGVGQLESSISASNLLSFFNTLIFEIYQVHYQTRSPIFNQVN